MNLTTADMTAHLRKHNPAALAAMQSQLAAQDARAPRRKPAKRAECPPAARTSETVLGKEITLHIETKSLNVREHWSVKARRVKAERRMAYIALLTQVPLPALPVKVTLTRRGPRQLDHHDNLRGALKPIADAVADAYGLRDDDAQIEWDYGPQIVQKGYAVDVKIEREAESAGAK